MTTKNFAANCYFKCNFSLIVMEAKLNEVWCIFEVHVLEEMTPFII